MLDEPISDDELTALALAADPEAPLDPEAVPLDSYLAPDTPGTAGAQGMTLPSWYMPAVRARANPRWRTAVVMAIVLCLLAIEAVGLCSTYGFIVPG